MKYFNIKTEQARANAIRTIQQIALDQGLAVEIKKQRRTLEQNAYFWALLTDIAEQLPTYHDIKMTKELYRDLFTGTLRGCTFVPASDSKGMVAIGGGSSRLNKSEFADLITLVEMFGANNGVKFSDYTVELKGV